MIFLFYLNQGDLYIIQGSYEKVKNLVKKWVGNSQMCDITGSVSYGLDFLKTFTGKWKKLIVAK